MRTIMSGLVCAALALLLAACGGGGGGGGGGSGSSGGGSSGGRPSSSSSGSGSGNALPIANAGADQAVTSGTTVTLNGTTSSDPDGTVLTYLWLQTVGPNVSVSNGATSQPTFVAPVVATPTAITFNLIVSDGAGGQSAPDLVTITVNPPLAGTGNVTGRVTYGRVPFATSGANPGLDYGNATQRPARNIVVNALAAGTNTVIATTTTNDSGDYSLVVTNNTSITLRIDARLYRNNAASVWNVHVSNGGGPTPYSYTDNVTFDSSAGTPRDFAIPTGINASGNATGTRASGPFAALDTIYQGILTVVAVAPNTVFPDLVVDWGAQDDGTFFDPGQQRIALLSDLSSDTDEFDQHVVAHEFGHYIEHNFSRADSIGGSHGLGDKLDPRVAFGEGLGYAFAAIVLNDPVARDSYFNGMQVSGSFNVETNPSSTPPGSPSGNFGSWASESSVWAILWDIYDSAADAGDNVALGFGPIWQVLAGEQRTTSSFTTIFPFIAALKVGRTNAEVVAINSLVNAQNTVATSINAFATTETNVPTPLLAADILPVYSTITRGGGAVQVRSIVDAEGDTYNALGNRHFLRFTSNFTGQVTLSVSTSNPNAAEADPDFFVWRAGDLVVAGQDFGPTESQAMNVVSGQTYVIEAFECANGCSSDQGTPGNYTLTATIN
jgi:hypothetical protein